MTPKAGRDLDARVAEEVMGWKPHVNKQGITEWCEPSKKTSLVGTVVQTEDFFCPSLDIGVAWSVLEKLRENHTVDIHEYSEGWEVVLIGPGSVAFDGQADTAPLAICLAALAAVGAPE